jgi:hypothetical protein
LGSPANKVVNKLARYAGIALLLVCAGCLIAQVLIRPAVGIANNGDFPKMAGPLGLGPELGTWESYPHGGEFVYRFVHADRFRYNDGYWRADFLSSEFFLVKAARGVQRIFQPGPRFDIRWLGAVQGALFLLAIGIWIYALAPRWRLWTGWLAVLIWTDVAYVQYLNSFYMDAAAMIFLLLCAAAGLHAIQNRNGWGFPLLTVCAATLFAATKAQHAIPAMVFLPLFLGLAFRSQTRLARGIWTGGSLLLLGGAFIVLQRSAEGYRSLGVYDMVFSRITPEVSDPLRTLKEFGLGRDELVYVNSFAYASNSPFVAHDQAWVRRFAARCNYGTLLKYYLRHPSVPIRFLYQDLSGPASRIVPWGNLSPDDGFKTDAQATHFTLWSNFRSFLLRRAPWHIVLLILVTLGGAVWLLVRSPSDRPFAGLLLTIQVLAIAEYGMAVLADSLETERHLFLFHVATEIVILSLPLLFLRVRERRGIRALAGV